MKKSNREITIWHNVTTLAWIALTCFFSVLVPFTLKSQLPPSSPNLLPGQTATLLADGRILLLGGESSARTVETGSIWDPRTNTTTHLHSRLSVGRAWHTATVLPDGMV